jgi:glyoxylase-like metal-dependent hydrolase (beta-lactamase superfamily II)
MTQRVLQSLVLIALTGMAVTARLSITIGAQQQASPGSLFKVYPVQGNVWLVPEPAANVVVSLGRDGVMLVDSGTADNANKLLATVKQLANDVIARPMPFTPCVGPSCAASRYAYGYASPSFDGITASVAPAKPIRYILNTSTHAAHVGGNIVIRKAGVTYVGGNITGTIGDVGNGAAIAAHEGVLHRMTQANAPDEALPTETYNGADYKLQGGMFFNDEGVQFFHPPTAHSDADSYIYFRYSDVIATGEIYNTVSYPVIDVEKGGTVDGVINALAQILDTAYPEFRSQGGTIIIPGRGRISDVADIANYRNMVYIIRDRIKDLKKKGRTLEQVKAAKPSLDYDGRWGAATGPWTTDMFIEAVYKTVK